MFFCKQADTKLFTFSGSYPNQESSGTRWVNYRAVIYLFGYLSSILRKYYPISFAYWDEQLTFVYWSYLSAGGMLPSKRQFVVLSQTFDCTITALMDRHTIVDITQTEEGSKAKHVAKSHFVIFYLFAVSIHERNISLFDTLVSKIIL